MTEWLENVKTGGGTSASTLARYDQVVRVHIIPTLGRIKLAALTPRDVQAMVSQLRKSVAPASVVKIHGVLRNALADAERMDLVPRNVAKSVRSATLSRTERRVLTPSEASKLLTELEGDRLAGLFVVALSTGLRRGELLGLRWSDVDLSGRTLFVRQALQRIDGQLRFVPPKTHRSARAVPLSQLAVAAISSQRAKQAEDRLLVERAWVENDLVFASQLGTPLEPRNVNRRFDPPGPPPACLGCAFMTCGMHSPHSCQMRGIAFNASFDSFGDRDLLTDLGFRVAVADCVNGCRHAG